MRSIERWGLPNVFYENLSDFLSVPSMETGIHTICIRESLIDLYIKRRPGRPLVIFLHGNAPTRIGYKLPVFWGVGIAKSLDASLLAICDPSLYLDDSLQLSWYAGSLKLNVRQLLPAIIRKVAEVFESTGIIFCGGSGGGYASLYYSLHFPKSISVVWNPQTNILAYNPVAVSHFSEICFGIVSKPTETKRLEDFISCNLAPLYNEMSNNNQVIYLQNNTDWHVEAHMRPFFMSVGADVTGIVKGASLNQRFCRNFWSFMQNWGDGHIAPPQPFLVNLLQEVVSTREEKLREMFNDQRFGSVIQNAYGLQAAQSRV